LSYKGRRETKRLWSRIKKAVLDALGKAKPRAADGVAALKREVTIRVRHFDEEVEKKAVTTYCDKYIGKRAEPYAAVFRNMRRQLAPLQGQERKTWVQVLRIVDEAVGMLDRLHAGRSNAR
jgi:hypothetical protein